MWKHPTAENKYVKLKIERSGDTGVWNLLIIEILNFSYQMHPQQGLMFFQVNFKES